MTHSILLAKADMWYRIKANCIDSTAPPEQVFAQEVEKLKSEKFFPKEQLTLGKYDGDTFLLCFLGFPRTPDFASVEMFHKVERCTHSGSGSDEAGGFCGNVLRPQCAQLTTRYRAVRARSRLGVGSVSPEGL